MKILEPRVIAVHTAGRQAAPGDADQGLHSAVPDETTVHDDSVGCTIFLTDWWPATLQALGHFEVARELPLRDVSVAQGLIRGRLRHA
ncbi:hypothetical protein MHEL_37610 [Mycolicibacterium helvum]|uniref:Uncharacterized protein n=1 Tax=Mycolicibacterium helvum TaxID=1534349 RepID=A0A7I7T8W8_9MYCO|nr:hypothetical protein MHEL_37610 [Mycolicibacterium helvum]